MCRMLIGLSLAKSGRVVGEIGEAFGVQDLQLDTAGYFSIFLVLLTLGSGLIWLIDHFMFAPSVNNTKKIEK